MVLRWTANKPFDRRDFTRDGDEYVLKGPLNDRPPPDPGYGAPDWMASKGKPRRGGHNVRDKDGHRLRTGAGTRIGRNKAASQVLRVILIRERRRGASIPDLAQAYSLSTRTVHEKIKPCMDERKEPAFKGRFVRKALGWARQLGGIPRVRKGYGRIDLKVNLHRKAGLVMAWIRYMLLSGFYDVQKALECIEASEKPP